MSDLVRSTHPPQVGGRLGIDLWVERADRDPMVWLSLLAAAGLVVAAGLAVFGMPPIEVHAPTHHFGIMVPACGMTRGAAATLRGDLTEAWWYNPASPLVIAGGIAATARWLVGRLTGRWVAARVRATALLIVITVVVLAVLEVNQQLHVDRLR
jgi:hypothetical protein